MVQKKELGGWGQWEDVIKVQSVCVGVCEIAKEETHFQKVKINLKVPKARKK